MKPSARLWASIASENVKLRLPTGSKLFSRDGLAVRNGGSMSSLMTRD